MVLADFPPSKAEQLTGQEHGRLPDEAAWVPVEERDLKRLLDRWLAETPAREEAELIDRCAQAYVQALATNGDQGPPLVQDLLAIALPESAGTAERVHALFFLADLLRHESEHGARKQLLRAAFAAMDGAGLHDLLAGPTAAMSRLCEEALAAELAPNMARQLIRRHRLQPSCLNAPDWPWPIRIYTLGRFAVICDDKPLAFNGKSPRRPLELLQALIAHGGRDIHMSVLMQSLWPEESHCDLQNLFDNTLHRLRRILGPADALHVRNGKLTLDPAVCWVDAWSFNRLTTAYMGAQSSPDSWSEADARLAWRLYSGHFLQSEAESAWLMPYRDRLRNRYHRLVCAYGTRLEQLQRWPEAIDVYERGLDVDNLAEMLYQRLMFCYLQLGEHAEALRVYRRCRELLSIVLNVAPSAKTEQLHRASVQPTR